MKTDGNSDRSTPIVVSDIVAEKIRAAYLRGQRAGREQALDVIRAVVARYQIRVEGRGALIVALDLIKALPDLPPEVTK